MFIIRVRNYILLGLVVLMMLVVVPVVQAWDKEFLLGAVVNNDFTLGPAKIEVWLDPGASTTRNLTITNRLGREAHFFLQTEDFVGSDDGVNATVLLGQQASPYSLKDYLQPEVMEFDLKQGEKANIPVIISLPEGLRAGGFYGAVLVNTTGTKKDEQSAGQIQAVGRLGALFFVRVNGPVQELGRLESFRTVGDKNIYQSGPVNFAVYYRNEGNVHLNPYGFIIVRNILGKEVATIKIDPYFAMPESLRYIERTWEKHLGLGWYRATLSLNRGYKNMIDTKTINIYILPWKIVLLGLAIIASLIALFWWLANNLEIKRKT